MSRSSQSGVTELDRLGNLEIWDAFYYPAWQRRGADSLVAAFDAERRAAERLGVTRQCAILHVGVGTAEPAFDRRIRETPELIRSLLRERADRVLGIARLNANNVAASLAAIDEWLVRGTMIGVCFPAGGSEPGALACDDENFDPLVRATTAAGGIIVQDLRYMTGEPDSPTLTTPAKLAVLAARHPNATFISAHAGLDWERGIRAVRASPNILVETSGFDSTAGFVEMAVRELGARRLVFGTHLPGRSLGTELAKVLAADLSDADRTLILGGNLRRLLAPTLRSKGLST